VDVLEEIIGDILVYDCETHFKGGADKDKLRLFGCYSYKTKKYYILTNTEDIQKIINAHKFLVGFNNEGFKGEMGYDNVVLKNAGINLQYKIIIDLMAIFKERAGGMKIKEGMLKDLLMKYSLDYITRTLHLVDDDSAKKHIDIEMFKKEVLTKEETEEMCTYLKRDVEVTKKLYEWCEDYFSVFKDFVTQEDINKKKYLTDSIAKFTYKAICKAVKWEPQFANMSTYAGEEEDNEAITGGFVSYPSGEEFHDNIYLKDFISMYPHAMIQAGLFNRKKNILEHSDRPTWNGSNVWKVQGVYYTDKMSDVAKLQRKLFFMRLFFKRKFALVEEQIVVKMKNAKDHIGKKIYVTDIYNIENLELQEVILTEEIAKEYYDLSLLGDDKREYSCKIILNTSYGILDNPYYMLVYDKIAAQDCTLLGQQWIKYARKVFRQNGYTNCYTDTDSLYIYDPFNDKEKLLHIKKQIIDYIKSTVPFPQLTFDMDDEEDIKHLFFFRGEVNNELEPELEQEELIGKQKRLMKKNYIYVKKGTFEDPKKAITIKNLGIRKKSISGVTKKIFWDYLVPQIVEKGIVKFSKTYIKNLMMELLEKDIDLATFRKDVGMIEKYSKSAGSIQAQISAKYGSGIHFMIPNTRGVGVGKGITLCTVEEFKERKLQISDIDMSSFWNELDYFIKPQVTKNIFDYH